MGLPKLVCLRSVYNNKYLRYKNENVYSHGVLQFAGETVMDPYAQFEVEEAKNSDGLVHLKSRYTNKYLVRWSTDHYWITASADEPNENESSWTCTLFKPIVVEECGDTKKIRLQHVQLGLYVILKRDGVSAPFISCIIAYGHEPDTENNVDVVTVVDWESIFKLPKRVAFKDELGAYLGAQTFDGEPGLQFSTSFKDPKDPKVVQQLFQSPDGTICFKSEYYGKFWRVGPHNWVVIDAEDPRNPEDNTAIFRHTVLDVNLVALLNMRTSIFLKRLTVLNNRESSLSAATENIDEYAQLCVVDVDK